MLMGEINYFHAQIDAWFLPTDPVTQTYVKCEIFTGLPGEIKINKFKLKSPRQRKTNKFVTEEFGEQRNKFITGVSGYAWINNFGTNGVDA